MGNITVEIKKADVVASSEHDFKRVTKEHRNLLHLEVEKNDDMYLYEYTVDEYTTLDEIKNLNLPDKYRVLLNLLSLSELANTLHLYLDPTNVYVNYNLEVKVAFRDLYAKDEIGHEERFINNYLILLGSILNDKTEFATIQQGGVNILKKHALTKKYASLKDVESIRNQLIEDLQAERTRRETKLSLVNKKTYIRMKWAVRILFLCVIVLAVLFGYFKFVQEPYKNSINKGYESYIVSDYTATIKELKNTSVSKMSKTTKYVLATSYIKSDALTDEQKSNILSGITITSEEKILDFWVYLAKDDVEESIDIAKQLGNTEYMVYGYMKQKAAIEIDSSLSGAERETKLNEVNQKLNQYKVDKNEKED
ncbi:type VII secretion protein EssB [Breznakia blatticola]|uniref:Type VII secretion protein EssB n=1 Tax=Breznakia blatticola TaxID=1754012 RepID=A0A4R7Z839_9FIRM|nr:type VII secretion protein EssB/YukC [Breznakia blatticola]TDW07792.1 type VII secretion protein EssB [Breznakia blatticola]